MAIYNLGTLEQPKQEVNPYMDMLMKFGMQSELQRQEIAGRKEIAKAQGEAEAKTYLARRELEQADATRKNLTATWQSLSDKPENERNLFVETEHGKEYLKVAKKYIPEVFDEGGKPIFFPSTKDQIKQQIDTAINGAKNKLLASGPDSLTEGERSILAMEGFEDIAAEAMGMLSKSPEFLYLSQSDMSEDLQLAQKMVTNVVNMLKSQRGTPRKVNELSNALNPVQTPTPAPANRRWRILK